MARAGARATVVPSASLAAALPGALELSNWTDELAVLPKAADGGGEVVVGFLGRIGREKGTDVLAEACALLGPELRGRLRLVVAGDDRFVPGRDRQRVQAALAASGVRVEQPGWVDPVAFLAGVDVVVVPSVRPESFGLVAAEAMAAGRPVVVTDAGALPEVVGPSHPWVAPRGDVPGLAMALGAAIAALPAPDVVAAQRRRWEREYSPAAGRHHVAELMGRLTNAGVLSR
jgi:glycosyltransferase involved in cell wall biosynthesis